MRANTIVSTHSRPKAAGYTSDNLVHLCQVSTHSRPKAAGTKKNTVIPKHGAFQHTAARRRLGRNSKILPGDRGFNTQPPEGGWDDDLPPRICHLLFQHTAARRRLDDYPLRRAGNGGFNTQPPEGGWGSIDWFGDDFNVSTHSRPKAAGRVWRSCATRSTSFNTQPPEGGWQP